MSTRWVISTISIGHFTTWYALRNQEDVRERVLIYSDWSLPTLLTLADQPVGAMRDLLSGLLSLLPRRFHASAMTDPPPEEVFCLASQCFVVFLHVLGIPELVCFADVLIRPSLSAQPRQ